MIDTAAAHPPPPARLSGRGEGDISAESDCGSGARLRETPDGRSSESEDEEIIHIGRWTSLQTEGLPWVSVTFQPEAESRGTLQPRQEMMLT